MPRVEDLGVGCSAIAAAMGVAAIMGVGGGVGVGEVGDTGWGRSTLDTVKSGRKPELRTIVTIFIDNHNIIRLRFEVFALIRPRWLD